MPGVNPPPNEYLLQLIGDMQKQIRALATQQQMVFTNAAGQTIISMGAIPPGGPANIPAGLYGFVAWSSSGEPVLVAYETTIPDGSGRRQTVTEVQRDDGTLALACADFGTAPNHPHQQALQWYDRLQGNVVVADDTISGVGLARPHIPAFGLANTNISTWPSTTATTSTSIASGYLEYQQPKLQLIIELYAPANVTGNFYLNYNGTNIAQTSLAGGTSGTFSTWNATVAVPSGLSFGAVYPINLNALVAAGSGTIYAQPYFLQGQGS